MKIRIYLLLTVFMSVFIMQCTQPEPAEFTNPVLAGYYPDPSVCKVGDDYYLVNSSFAYYPGIPVFQSKDLVNWKLIGHVLNDPAQFDLEGHGVSRGVFAPAITYHDGLYYVVCTLVDMGGNFVATAENPAGPWSAPVYFPQINGIDPSLFFDEDKAYILYNSVAPDNKPLWGGHRTIRMREFDANKLELTGDEMILVNGGVDTSQHPVWIEGPHIYKINDLYYLMAAEGGTAEDHSEVIFRSDKVTGPFKAWEGNPILTQRHLDPARANAITCTGHADMVQASDGNWWAVFLGCRPYAPHEENYFNTGRETFLAPVTWTDDGWPVINPDHDEIQYRYPYPEKPQPNFAVRPYSGNYALEFDFDNAELALDWTFLRTLHEKWYDLSDRAGYLKLELRPETCAGTGNPSFVAQHQSHLYGSVSTALRFSPESDNELAGLLVFQNERHYYLLCQGLGESGREVRLYKSMGDSLELLAAKPVDLSGDKELMLRINANGKYYAFFYGTEPDMWLTLAENVDATFLSTRTAGGFVGCMYALYATSNGRPSGNAAWFDWYKYEGHDKVYGEE